MRTYAEIIENAVHEVMPHAAVQVEKDYYCVDPTPKQGDAVRIGRQICRSALCQYCVQIPDDDAKKKPGISAGLQCPSPLKD